ncbi:MAG: phospho-sugar mutase, partial [Planctomycetaceae bacterium]|nr:phospho-sugar mutase [Planctomycetaceae bacterium]
MSSSPLDLPAIMALVTQAVSNEQLSATAAENIHRWLSEERYAAYAPLVIEHIDHSQWQELDDAFWTVIPFGTGGRRGRMYPIGSNTINDRTIGESARGLADYMLQVTPDDQNLACAIAYDTRHKSRHFAELCAEIMVAAGFQVYFLDDYRPTPELSFLVRQQDCQCGIMVTASHNPPSDNAVKVYGPSGGQVLPPHDQGIIDAVAAVQMIPRIDFATAVTDGRIILDTVSTDTAYQQQVVSLSVPGPRDLKVVYSPLHGVGSSSVLPVLQQAGFADVHVYEPHATPDGDFPNVPEHVSNPENPAIFDQVIADAQNRAADLVLVTDPDADRMGCAAPITADTQGDWATLDGNSLSALLADYVLSRYQATGGLESDHYIIKTLVTTELVRRIANAYGVRTQGDVLVGFKWICGCMDDEGADQMLFATEESHGFLVGQHVRDKDGIVACLLMAELAAQVKAEGQSIHDRLERLYEQHGIHQERTLNLRMEGSQGMQRMTQLMAALRSHPPTHLGDLAVINRRDYLQQVSIDTAGNQQPL